MPTDEQVVNLIKRAYTPDKRIYRVSFVGKQPKVYKSVIEKMGSVTHIYCTASAYEPIDGVVYHTVTDKQMSTIIETMTTVYKAGDRKRKGLPTYHPPLIIIGVIKTEDQSLDEVPAEQIFFGCI